MMRDLRCIVCNSHLSNTTISHLKQHEKSIKHQLALKVDHKIKIIDDNIECPCGSTVQKKSFLIHIKSNRHKQYEKFYEKNISHTFLENN
tara:strand:- start:194 stop:463 length:270 start_codon:yes stop_codon:yes gene_type:complete